MLKVLLILIFTTSAWAMPSNFEVWFLSVDKTAELKQYLDQSSKNQISLAQNNYQCQPMGEFCFDPQIGLYKKGSEDINSLQVDNAEFENKQDYDFIDPASSLDRQMIECDKSHFFDVFCGKAQKQSKAGKTPLEVWIDVSSTMKQVDFKGFNQQCARERFLEDLSQTCTFNQKMKVYYFTEFKFEAGAFDRTCLSNGLNNLKKLKQDIINSNAKNLIIITDIFEAKEEFTDWIESTGKGKIKGIDKPLYASSINKELKRIRKMCN